MRVHVAHNRLWIVNVINHTNQTTRDMCDDVCTGILERHKLVFSFQQLTCVMDGEGALNRPLAFVLKGNTTVLGEPRAKPPNGCRSEPTWKDLIVVKDPDDAYSTLVADLRAKAGEWHSWCDLEAPPEMMAPVPTVLKRMEHEKSATMAKLKIDLKAELEQEILEAQTEVLEARQAVSDAEFAADAEQQTLRDEHLARYMALSGELADAKLLSTDASAAQEKMEATLAAAHEAELQQQQLEAEAELRRAQTDAGRTIGQIEVELQGLQSEHSDALLREQGAKDRAKKGWRYEMSREEAEAQAALAAQMRRNRQELQQVPSARPRPPTCSGAFARLRPPPPRFLPCSPARLSSSPVRHRALRPASPATASPCPPIRPRLPRAARRPPL